MKQEIQVIARDVYGQVLTYPVCNKAKLLAELTGKKTFTTYTINLLQKLGYTLVYTTLKP